jgi:hypothetical protein
MVGEMIIVRIAALYPEEMSLVKLHAVELTGIWIECQDFTDAMMQKCRLSTSITTPVLFVPFTSIEFILGSIYESSAARESRQWCYGWWGSQPCAG